VIVSDHQQGGASSGQLAASNSRESPRLAGQSLSSSSMQSRCQAFGQVQTAVALVQGTSLPRGIDSSRQESDQLLC